MENKDFAVFILTHGRPDKVITYDTLKKQGYTGRIIIVIDNEDKKADRYIEKFGAENVVIFDKKEIAKITDKADNFDGLRSTIYPRNAFWKIAKELGIKYFVQLDDDYISFLFRYVEGGRMIKRIDRIFDIFVNYLKSTPITTVAFSQGGDHIGGYDDDKRVKRKAMNSFFCSVDRPFKFIGRLNEDVNTYVRLGSIGEIFLTIANVQLNQVQTQTNSGGMSETYINFGTYVKSFYTVMISPSCVSINTMGRSNRRLHHAIDWECAVPKIIEEKYKK